MGPLLPPSPFDPAPQRAGTALRGGAVAIGGQGLRTAVRLGGTVILARLLTPEDFGLVAMVTVVTGFVGLRAAIIQPLRPLGFLACGRDMANDRSGHQYKRCCTAGRSPICATAAEEFGKESPVRDVELVLPIVSAVFFYMGRLRPLNQIGTKVFTPLAS